MTDDLVTALKTRRISLGMSQQQLADVMDTRQSHVSELEAGKVQPTLPVLCRWADALACDVRLVDRLAS